MNPLNLISWLFAAVVFTTGILNLVLVHPVPGIAYMIVSQVYLPPVNTLLKNRYNMAIPLLLKLALAVILFMFTLGVSDLGDMIDKL